MFCSLCKIVSVKASFTRFDVVSEAAIQRWSSENIQHNTHAEVQFNKVAINFIEITLRHGCSPVNLLHIFKKLFPRNTSGWLLLLFGSIKLLRQVISLFTASEYIINYTSTL